MSDLNDGQREDTGQEEEGQTEEVVKKYRSGNKNFKRRLIIGIDDYTEEKIRGKKLAIDMGINKVGLNNFIYMNGIEYEVIKGKLYIITQSLRDYVMRQPKQYFFITTDQVRQIKKIDTDLFLDIMINYRRNWTNFISDKLEKKMRRKYKLGRKARSKQVGKIGYRGVRDLVEYKIMMMAQKKVGYVIRKEKPEWTK